MAEVRNCAKISFVCILDYKCWWRVPDCGNCGVSLDYRFRSALYFRTQSECIYRRVCLMACLDEELTDRISWGFSEVDTYDPRSRNRASEIGFGHDYRSVGVFSR